jgi:asparagine synthase (glutamine-hydrolysing)
VSADRWDQALAAAGPLVPREWRYRLFGEKVHKVGVLMDRHTPAEFYRSLVAAWDDAARLVPGGECPDGTFESIMAGDEPAGMGERMMLADIMTYLPDNNLAKVDRASMAVSLEVRVPLLDHRVVEHAMRLPPEFKLRSGGLKWVLRQVLYRYVPRELVEREKMGFDVPIGTWLRGPLRPWADALLSERALGEAGLNAPMVRRRWDAHQAGRGNHGLALWTVLMFQAWRARWVD